MKVVIFYVNSLYVNNLLMNQGDDDDSDKTFERARSLRSRLAEDVPHLLVRPLSNPAHRGFRGLVVINEDWIAPGAGFPPHPHEDMEIVTLVHSGSLEHRDSLGNGDVIRRGEFQRMTAGTGIEHAEFNPSKTEPVHLHQIWILPEREGLPPSYEQRANRPGTPRTIAFEPWLRPTAATAR